MTQLPAWAYVAVFVATVLLTLALTPVAMSIAWRFGVLDRPGPRKQQTSPVPYLGGLAIAVSFGLVAGTLALAVLPRTGLPPMAVFLALAAGVAALGTIDDVRGLTASLRVVLEIGAGVGVWITGKSVWIPGPRPLAAVATVLWVVVVTNAFNLLDNMDGLAAGVAAISAIFLAVIAIHGSQFLVGSVALALAGSAFGFLRYNMRPARIYMGDAGSLFLGFTLAVLSLTLHTGEVAPMSFCIPVLVLAVALGDTVLVTITRLLNHRNPLSGGLDHSSHRLVKLGRSKGTAVLLLYGCSAVLGGAALAMTDVDRVTGSVLALGLAVVLGVVGVVLAGAPVYGPASALRILPAASPAQPRRRLHRTRLDNPARRARARPGPVSQDRRDPKSRPRTSRVARHRAAAKRGNR